MKILLKNIVPIFVAAFGISGAFVSTAMQKKMPKITSGPILGHTVNPVGKCTNIVVTCSDLGTSLCRLNLVSGPIAYQKDGLDNCIQPLYRP